MGEQTSVQQPCQPLALQHLAVTGTGREARLSGGQERPPASHSASLPSPQASATPPPDPRPAAAGAPRPACAGATSALRTYSRFIRYLLQISPVRKSSAYEASH